MKKHRHDITCALPSLYGRITVFPPRRLGASALKNSTCAPDILGGNRGTFMNSKNEAISKTTRREMLQFAGEGMAAAALSATAGNALAQETSKAPANTSGKIPFSLIIDDGSPVDPLFYELPGYETPFLVPAEFTRRVADTFDRFDLRGKLTIIPMPSCLGRIDKSLKRVPQEHLDAFLKIVRERISPRFDITPEFLTHLRAYNLKTGDYQHIYEDVWITRAPIEEIVEYFTLALQILQHVD